jgi:hypothetical protein
MTTPTDTDIPPCPDATLWEFTTYRADRRTKTGWRLVEEYTMNYPDERDALHHAQEVESLTGSRVEYRPRTSRSGSRVVCPMPALPLPKPTGAPEPKGFVAVTPKGDEVCSSPPSPLTGGRIPGFRNPNGLRCTV